VSWTRDRGRFLLRASLVLATTAALASCVAYQDTYEVDVRATVVDGSPHEGERYYVMLLMMNPGACTQDYWYASCEVLDFADGGSPGTARLQGLAQTEGDDCSPVLYVAAFRDRDGDGWWDSEGNEEPCAMAPVDAPYLRDEPIELDVWTRSCWDEYSLEYCDQTVLTEEEQP